MAPSIHVRSTASYDRADDWQACCARVMGYDDWPTMSMAAHTHTIPEESLQVTNLLPSELFDDDSDDPNEQVDTDNKGEGGETIPMDAWMKSAFTIQSSLETMAQWIQSKKYALIGFDTMTDAEASLIQSTVTSFAATTANEIESLRQMTLASTEIGHNQLQHRTGIVQILMARLKETIVEPYGVLQKMRSRKAVDLWQNPLQCPLLVKSKSMKRKKRDHLDEALGLGDDDDEQGDLVKEQRFMPSRDSHPLRHKFMDTYIKDESLPRLTKRPKSLIRDPLSALSSETEAVYNPNSDPNGKYLPTSQRQDNQPSNHLQVRAPMPGMKLLPQSEEEISEVAQQQMQQEALLLERMAHSDLDSVQKMEQQMVSITTLLTQFSELVSEQQEEVEHIHETAKETEDNIKKGQESLVDAAHSSHQSGHYMAKGIFGLSCLLLLFHWLRP